MSDEIERRALMASVKVIEDPRLARLKGVIVECEARITELEAERDAWISLDKARLKRITELEAESDYAIRALAEMRTVLEAVDHDDRHLRPLSEHARRKVRAALSKTEEKK